jgi:hypothetical protein
MCVGLSGAQLRRVPRSSGRLSSAAAPSQAHADLVSAGPPCNGSAAYTLARVHTLHRQRQRTVLAAHCWIQQGATSCSQEKTHRPQSPPPLPRLPGFPALLLGANATPLQPGATATHRPPLLQQQAAVHCALTVACTRPVACCMAILLHGPAALLHGTAACSVCQPLCCSGVRFMRETGRWSPCCCSCWSGWSCWLAGSRSHDERRLLTATSATTEGADRFREGVRLATAPQMPP